MRLGTGGGWRDAGVRRRLVPALIALCFGIGAEASEPVVSTFAGNGKRSLDGDGGDRREASLESPAAMVWADAGSLLYLDRGGAEGGRVRRIDIASGIIETVAGGGALEAESVPARDARLMHGPASLAVDSRGNLFIGYELTGRVDRVDAQTGLVARFAGGGDSLGDDVASTDLALQSPISLRVDAADNLYVVDSGLHAVFRLDASTGRATRIAGTPGQSGYSGDGDAATSALLRTPGDVGWDGARNLYIADRDNHVIRRIDAQTGTISTLAGVAGSPGFSGDGGPAESAQFRYPQSLLVEGRQVLVADRMNHRIRRIDLDTGVITTVAGSHRPGYAGENVPALAAGLFEPTFMLRDSADGLLVVAARARRIYLVGDPVQLPVPWWRSAWAIAGYLACLALLIATVVRIRTRTLRARNAELEALVRQRASALKEQQGVMKQQTIELAALIESRDRMLARISHEFRTPLTVILGPISRLLEKAPDGVFKESLPVIEHGAGRLLRRVEQTLNLARLSHGQAGPPSPVAAAPLVRRVVASYGSRASQSGVDLAPGRVQDVIVQANAQALEAILLNLVSNAVKFTTAGGRVRVALQEADGAAEFLVEDTGCGIEPERLGQLFEPSPAGPAVADRDAEEGLGLALVGQLVQAQGGSVGVESEPGVGSRFWVRLPLANVAPARVEPAPGPSEDAEAAGLLQSGPPGRDATVLVIEDNDDMRAYLGALLATHYRCLLAGDGEQGLSLALEESPDLVVSDLMLPGQDGYQVCRALKSDERTSHIPVILLTALDGEQDKLKGLEERADDYLTKPFEEDELTRRIQNLLEIRSLLQRRYARELRFDQHPPAELNERDQSFLARLSAETAARHGDPEFGPAVLARALAASERQLQRKLKALTGLTPAEYVRGYRLQQALERLQAGERPSEVAYAVGFGSQAYFTTCFKAQFGYTPGQARERRAPAPEMTA